MLRKLLDLVKLAGTVVAVQAIAPVLAADLPSFHRLSVSRVKHRLHGMYNDSYESLVHGFMDPTALEEEPEQLIIKGGSSDPHSGPWTIGIDLEEQIIGYATWGSLTNKRDGGSGEIGVVLLGLPGLIVTSPLLVVWGLARSTLRWFTGMDLHTWLVWLKIRDQIPFEWQEQARTAFVNQCNGVAEAYWEERRREYEAEMHDEYEDDEDYEG